MARKLYVICGHGNGDSGAVGGGYTEASLVRKLGAAMVQAGNGGVVLLDTSKNWYAQGLVNADLKKKVGSNPVIELHMDSAGASAKGGHVIIKAGLTEDADDKRLMAYLKKEFPGRADILVKRSNLANVNRAGAQKINFRLTEVCFITNSSDRKKFIGQLDDIAKGIVGCFPDLDTAKPVSSTAKPTKPEYTKGRYKTTMDKLNVRTKPKTGSDSKILKKSQLTANAQKNAHSDGTLKKGTVMDVSETRLDADGNTWGKIPSGYICMKYKGKSRVAKG